MDISDILGILGAVMIAAFIRESFLEQNQCKVDKGYGQLTGR